MSHELGYARLEFRRQRGYAQEELTFVINTTVGFAGARPYILYIYRVYDMYIGIHQK